MKEHGIEVLFFTPLKPTQAWEMPGRHQTEKTFNFNHFKDFALTPALLTPPPQRHNIGWGQECRSDHYDFKNAFSNAGVAGSVEFSLPSRGRGLRRGKNGSNNR